ncbi:mitochondrial Zn-dependent carboxypeptidase [Andalucia godoyi]|uniref:Mitochondrial Zn-dependent carboxypeptidase n=1 Tax=Andalucia godoyi TaxID=505711 RepID=A0A8K0AHL9_ANDGO|nr:mitochondrial Zn-dependent carboxypeptidase [Andalucia godoyi]|eukprot:ANDGO_06945.mRNA.1 mitochondrial Zn-dependent carboxypeptidase
MSTVRSVYDRLCVLLRRSHHFSGVNAIMQYDQQVFMPAGAASVRASQLELIAGFLHDLNTDPEFKTLFDSIDSFGPESVEKELTAYESAVIREARIKYRKHTSIPKNVEEERAKLESEGYDAWVRAKKAKDFSIFAPNLEKNLQMARTLASYMEPEKAQVNAYDVWIDQFERGLTQARLDPILKEIRTAVVPLLEKVLAARKNMDNSFAEVLSGTFDVEKLRKANEEIVKRLGFDFENGRMDASPHPFTTSSSPHDVRITTRYRADEWLQSITGSIHEAGHAFYEQNLKPTGLPVDEYLSMGIHESQSLFWERMVGLSNQFWKFAAPIVRDVGGVPLKLDTESEFADLMKAINDVNPNFIRVESDELTYVMHILMRYEFEAQMLAGTMKISELPQRWNAQIKDYLGLEVTDDAVGCLQDVHWSSPFVGYFPTYLLGAMNAAQIFAAVKRDIPDVMEKVEKGEFAVIKEWLTNKIHTHGTFYPSADELLTHATGEPMNPKYFIAYLREKYCAMYNIDPSTL